MVAVLSLVLMNFMIPTIAPAAPVRDGPFVILGEQSSAVYSVTHERSDNWAIHAYYGFFRTTFHYIVKIGIVDVFDDGRTILWEDVEVIIVRDDETRVLDAHPFADPRGLELDDHDDTIFAMYENDQIMHGYVYPGDTFYLLNLPADLDGAVVELTFDGESLGSFKMDIDLIFQFYL